MRKLTLAMITLALTFSFNVNAADEIQAASLAELLQMVKEGKLINKAANERREKAFIADKNAQQKAVTDAKRMQSNEEARSERLETTFEKNEQELANLTETLQKRLGSLRELFGVLQQVSGDTQGVFEGSIISAEFPGRGEWLGEFAQSMGKSSKLASIEEIERLWFELQREMTESAKVSKFTALVNKLDGEVVEQEIIRVGTFNLVSEGVYVTYDIENQIVKELARQPAGRFVDSTAELQVAADG
jgi:biopolymer transport protein ExbB